MTSRRLTVQEAAEVLGTSVDEVRMRVRRGSLESEKDPDARVYVWVDGDASETKPELEGESTALISAKDETIRVLNEQLQAERQAHAEARRLLAGALDRIPPQLETPRESSEASESVVEDCGGAGEGTLGPVPQALRRALSGLGIQPSFRCVGRLRARGGGGCSVADLWAPWALDHSSVERRTLRRAREKPRRSIRGSKG